jgi:hypothetical protein
MNTRTLTHLSRGRRIGWLLPALGTVLLGMAGVPAAQAASSGVDSELLALQHEAELQRGEKLLIGWHPEKAKDYRICIPQQPGNIKVKVLHDGSATEVVDGTCRTITGNHVDLMSDSKLQPGQELVLKFKDIRS